MKKCYLLFLVIAIFSCNEKEELMNRDISIAEAREHFNSLDQYTNTRVSTTRAEFEVMWEDGLYEDISIGDALVFPLDFKEDLFVTDSTKRVISPAEASFYAFAYKLDDEVHLEFVRAMKMGNTEEFTGNILVEDWYGNPLRFFKYENGEFVSEHEIVNEDNVQNQRLGEFVYTCTTTVYYTCWGDIPVDCREDSRSTTCVISQVIDGSDSGGIGGGDYGPGPARGSSDEEFDCDAGGGYFDDGNGGCERIYNEVEEPCLKDAVDDSFSMNSSDDLVALIVDLFGDSEEIDLEFYEDGSLPDDILAYADINDQPNSPIYIAAVYLNANVLPHASKEIIISTILHESLHAYFGYFGLTGELNQHNEMAYDYVHAMAQVLLARFDTLSPWGAEALSWGGLQETDIWKNEFEGTLEGSKILKFNEDHTKGTKGTTCD